MSSFCPYPRRKNTSETTKSEKLSVPSPGRRKVPIAAPTEEATKWIIDVAMFFVC